MTTPDLGTGHSEPALQITAKAPCRLVRGRRQSASTRKPRVSSARYRRPNAHPRLFRQTRVGCHRLPMQQTPLPPLRS